jgi:hypothetical protein
VEDYYNVTLSQYNIASTEDGWPAESYVEFSKSKRLLIGWGTIDLQMAGYNFSESTLGLSFLATLSYPVSSYAF